MSDFKRIGNRRLMSALADALGIEGVSQRAPIGLDTSRLVPTISLDAGWAAYETFQKVNLSQPINLISTYTYCVVGTGTGNPLESAFPNNQKKEVVLMGMWVSITYDGPGRAADEGARVELVHFRNNTAAGSPAIGGHAIPWFRVQPSQLSYVWSYPWLQGELDVNTETGALGLEPIAYSIPPLWVPANTRFELVVARPDGGTWPANTTIQSHFWGVACPQGMRPPGM